MRKREEGVTLFELLIVIVVLGVVAAIGAPRVTQAFENMQRDQLLDDVRYIEQSAKTFCSRSINECEIGDVLTAEDLEEYLQAIDLSYDVSVKRIGRTSYGVYYAKSGEFSFPFNEEGRLLSKEFSPMASSRERVHVANPSSLPESPDDPAVFPEWESGAFGVGDRVSYNDRVFELRDESGITTPPEEENLEPYGPFQEVEIGNEFRIFNTYHQGDEVHFQGATYVMLYEGGNGEYPDQSYNWQEQTVEWRYYNVYQKDDVVMHHGDQYMAHEYNEGVEPGTPEAEAIWQNLSTDEWDPNNIYYEDDVVLYEGVLYEAQWWTQGDNPAENSGPYQVWQEID